MNLHRRELRNQAQRPIIIGFGPAGMFAALELIAHGFKPIIFERGKRLEERTRDVRMFMNERILNPESNIQFGEGGAGAYSDGKLFSRKVNTSPINQVLNTFIEFGAPGKIGTVSKPHLGTDVLRGIVCNIRAHILAQGGEIHYNARMTELLLFNNQAVGVVINGETEYACSSLYLAVGHSARDTFEMLASTGVRLEQKPITIGMRVEHPAAIINQMRRGDPHQDVPAVGAATYSLNYTDRKLKRGVYTFCMCPGGEVVNASSEAGLLVVNGMSYAQRAAPFSNAALVVNCHLSDYPSTDPLAGIAFQKAIESQAFRAGGGSWRVPAQNLLDYMSGKESDNLNLNSCATGTVAADMRDLFPSFINDTLMAAFAIWQESYPLFVSPHAILIGAETRAAAPLRIVRGADFASVNIRNLYPIGEGSGYTGGITSSAADAIRAVTAVVIE